MRFRYVQQNVRYCAEYRTYNSGIPAFLHNRPSAFLEHVCTKWQSAAELSKEHVTAVDDKTFIVTSAENEYNVFFGDDLLNSIPACECLD
jgi:hypothetical protein